jgi:rhodanese-related sulfurtransferase
MDTSLNGGIIVNKKMTIMVAAIGIFFIVFIIIFVNQSMAKNENMAGMPGMSKNGDMKETNVPQSIDGNELEKYLNNPDVTIVDVRESTGYSNGHIPNAINIPFQDFQQRYKELDSSKFIILVCHSGGMGQASGQFLLQKGFKHVANLSGGMAKWTGKVIN